MGQDWKLWMLKVVLALRWCSRTCAVCFHCPRMLLSWQDIVAGIFELAPSFQFLFPSYGGGRSCLSRSSSSVSREASLGPPCRTTSPLPLTLVEEFGFPPFTLPDVNVLNLFCQSATSLSTSCAHSAGKLKYTDPSSSSKKYWPAPHGFNARYETLFSGKLWRILSSSS